MKRYFLHWRGQKSGPFTLEEIEQKLAVNEIGLWHQVVHDGAELTVGDFLQQIKRGKEETRLRLEQDREREQREARQRADYQHAQALQKLQEQNDILADEIEDIRAKQITFPPVPPNPFLQSNLQIPSPPYGLHTQRTSGQAVTAFIFALLNFVPVINFISWLVALVLAHSALSDMRRDPSIGGRGFAVAALWITYVLLFLGIIIGILIAIGGRSSL